MKLLNLITIAAISFSASACTMDVGDTSTDAEAVAQLNPEDGDGEILWDECSTDIRTEVADVSSGLETRLKISYGDACLQDEFQLELLFPWWSEGPNGIFGTVAGTLTGYDGTVATVQGRYTGTYWPTDIINVDFSVVDGEGAVIAQVSGQIARGDSGTFEMFEAESVQVHQGEPGGSAGAAD